MYYLSMSSKYSKDLASILQMLKNIEEDLNLINYSETEKKYITQLHVKIQIILLAVFLM